MLRSLLVVWFLANFLLVGVASLLAGGWYLGWKPYPLAGVAAELGLVMLPNLVLPVVLLLRRGYGGKAQLSAALGWRWTGWRALLAGGSCFMISVLITMLITHTLGAGIPYALPGAAPISAGTNLALALVILLGLLIYIVLTVVGEETMFRGLIQTQTNARYGVGIGLVLTALMFGLRHLPADIYYSYAWNATPQMWLSRELQLYSFALLIGLARHLGRSTFGSALMHLLTFSSIVFGGP